jgi:hypothetical protein
MAHRFGEAILVRRAPGLRAELPRRATDRATDRSADLAGAPIAFHWRGVWYQVDAVLGAWRLRDRWWAGPAADVAEDAHSATSDPAGAAPATWPATLRGMPPADTLPPTERVYFRVLCRDPEGEQVFDLYFDAASSQWMLDRVHD